VLGASNRIRVDGASSLCCHKLVTPPASSIFERLGGISVDADEWLERLGLEDAQDIAARFVGNALDHQLAPINGVDFNVEVATHAEER
jgi:hypothetical protein